MFFFRVLRDPRATAMDSDNRPYTIRDPRANSNVVPLTQTSQMPPQMIQPTRPQVVQLPPKPGSSTDTEKVHNSIVFRQNIINYLSIKTLHNFILGCFDNASTATN